MGEERAFTVSEVTTRLPTGPEAVCRWIREGKLAGFMPGGTKTGYRILRSEVERFIAVARNPTEERATA